MSIKWISYIWDRTDYRAGEGLVALALADSANEEGNCHPYIETIAKKARLSVRHVQRILKNFESDGFLEIQRFQGRGKYPILQLKKVTSATPFADRQKVTSATIKGDICDIKKVTSATLSLNKEEPLIEPLINRVENEDVIKNDFPLKQLYEAFPNLHLESGQIGFILAAVSESDKDAWAATIEIYKQNYDPEKSRYLPDKVGNLLSVFKSQKKITAKSNGDNKNGNYKSTYEKRDEAAIRDYQFAEAVRQHNTARRKGEGI